MLSIVYSLVLGMVLVAQPVPYVPPTTPTAPTTHATPITAPASGDFWNPANWPGVIRELTVPGFFALVFFGYIVYREIRDHKDRKEEMKQPKNSEQLATLEKAGADRVKLLKLMVRAASNRHAHSMAVWRQIVALVAWNMQRQTLNENEKQILDSKLSCIYGAINTPPPIDAQLTIDEIPDDEATL